MALIIGLEIGTLASLYLWFIYQKAPERWLKMDACLYKKMWMYSMMVGGYIGLFLSHWFWYGQLACGILGAYLLVASIQDLHTCQVYDFLHIPAAIVGFCFVLAEPSWGRTGSLVFYFLIQLGVFMRMYGEADGMVFMVCAIFETRFGKGILTYLYHMGTAFLLLGAVQGYKRNINKRGNLKEPVPFVPYIAVTVWLFL